MTRINTNVSSLTAQQNLQKSNSQLQTALTRLSTGLRINSGKDDPAGMISAAQLGSEINSTNTAISNSKTAEQIIDTADSALSQVTTLLNNIRGLITQAANQGAMSPDQIAANQSQVDSSLDAINRIAQTTNYQGLNLLDGTMGYQYSQGNNFSDVKSLALNQVTMGTAANMQVTVNVNHAAKQASLDTHFATSGTAAQYQAITNEGTLTVTAPAAGTDYNNMTVNFATTTGAAAPSAKYDTATNTLTISVYNSTHKGGASSNGQTLVSEVQTALTNTEKYTNGVDQNSHLAFVGTANVPNTSVIWNTANDATAAAPAVAATGEGSSADFGIVHVTAKNGGAAGNVNVVFVTGASDAVDASVPGTLTVTATDHQALSAIATYVTGHSNFTMTASPDGTYVDANDTGLQAGFTLTGGADAITAVAPTQVTTGTNNGIPEAAVFNLTGDKGSSVIQFTSTMSVADAVKAINAVSDSTGVTAAPSTTNGGTVTHITLTSADYGKSASVQIGMISGGATFQNNMIETVDNLATATLSTTGTDVDATVNGVAATGAGNSLSVATPALDMSMQVAPNLADSTSIGFTINGGGALYQLGANINTNNQADMGIQSTDTGHLGGSAGYLYELRKGNDADLSTDPATAANIVDQAVNQVTSLRGRLGAFEQTTLETNVATLGDTVNALTNAQSTIQDADFAAETANLTRAQILVQSGTSVLQIANRGPQQVLTLLQNA